MGRVKIIAEAGVNHNGSFDTAAKMVKVAKECGVDCVKFQIEIPEACISKFAQKAEYQIANTGTNESQLELCKSFMLPFDDFRKLKEVCEKEEVEFLATPYDIYSVEYLNQLNVDSYKIPSGEVTNLPYLISIAKIGKPIYLSTGMCDMEEVKTTVRILKENGAKEIIVLHCTTDYPAKYEDVNLRAMISLREELNLPVGYSDHTEGIIIPVAAVALGAVVVEKHFTLDRTMKGPDHKASIEPDELKEMVSAIRNMEAALGDGKKEPTAAELKYIDIVRKSIIAKRDIKEGELFSEDNVTTKRPGDGISPMRWDEVIGRRAKRNFEMDELIEI